MHMFRHDLLRPKDLGHLVEQRRWSFMQTNLWHICKLCLYIPRCPFPASQVFLEEEQQRTGQGLTWPPSELYRLQKAVERKKRKEQIHKVELAVPILLLLTRTLEDLSTRKGLQLIFVLVLAICVFCLIAKMFALHLKLLWCSLWALWFQLWAMMATTCTKGFVCFKWVCFCAWIIFGSSWCKSFQILWIPINLPARVFCVFVFVALGCWAPFWFKHVGELELLKPHALTSVARRC